MANVPHSSCLSSAMRKKLNDKQRAERDVLEGQIKKLRGQQAALGEETYYQQLEKLLRELAAVYGP